MKKKILHVINSMTTGGAETLLANSLSQGGLQEHTDNMVVYLQGSSHLINLIDKNVKIHCLHYEGIFNLPATLRKLRKIIKQYDPDIVHTHLSPAGVYTHWACPATVPQVHTVHTTYSMDTEARPMIRLLDRYFYFNRRNCNLILLSEFTKRDILKAIPFRGNAFVLNNFVPDIFFKNSVRRHNEANGQLKLMAAGTLKELKNFEYLLEVFKYLKDQEIYLDIFGAGDKTKYEQVIKADNLKVRMMGYREDMTTVFTEYDMFILPSKFEGFPLVVFEAMASGVPLLLSNIAPVKSIVNEHAVYFELDNAEAAADVINSVWDKKIDIDNMAKNAKTYAEGKVRREIYINNLLEIYANVKPNT